MLGDNKESGISVIPACAAMAADAEIEFSQSTIPVLKLLPASSSTGNQFHNATL
jgi:hypothetical protein